MLKIDLNEQLIDKYRTVMTSHQNPYGQSSQTQIAINIFQETVKQFSADAQCTTIDILKDRFFSKIDESSSLSDSAKKSAKLFFNSTFQSQYSVVSYAPNQDCKEFKLSSPQEIKHYYQLLKIVHSQPRLDIVKKISGDAASIGYAVHQQNPLARIGIMIAANSGLPGGALGKRPSQVTEEDLGMSTQEESIWANSILTECGTDSQKQSDFHLRTIQSKWGMKEIDPSSRDTHTIQGIDFTHAEESFAYNGVYVVEHHFLSAHQNGKLIASSQYPVTFIFADSVNAGNEGKPTGTMQRTKNLKAVADYNFFRECVKTKLRSAIDAMAVFKISHSLIACLSTGVYAGSHRQMIIKDFDNILSEVLSEIVGPSGEQRHQYFEEIIIPVFSRR